MRDVGTLKRPSQPEMMKTENSGKRGRDKKTRSGGDDGRYEDVLKGYMQDLGASAVVS